MSKTVSHPTNDELTAFALGDLPPGVASKVEQHVSDCDPCCQTIVGLASDDTFLGLLQKAGANSETSSGGTIENATGAASNATLDDIPGPLRDHPRYEIQRLVGRGGMGRVYRARHRVMNRVVALKVIHHEWVRRRETVERFHREMTTAARLDHPNIVTAFDAEQADDLHFLAMEYVDGVDLAQTVEQRGRISVSQACDYIKQAAKGLQHAHEQGMVHRDIKPHNLIVTPDNVVKILDFGLTSLAPETAAVEADREPSDSQLTVAGSIMGTPDFMSPEQATDASQVDGRSDIYSLGMTMYYLLSGQVPFAEGSASDKLRQHAESEPTALVDMRADVSSELCGIVTRMTAKNPDNRLQTPADVIAAIENLPADRQHRVEESGEQAKRSGLSGILRGAVLLALICAFGIFLYGRNDRIAKADYVKLATFLQTGESDEFHSDIVDRLLRSSEGRRYLRILDAENKTFAYTEGDFANGYSSVVMYAYDDIGREGASPEIMLRGWSLTTMGMATRSFFKEFSLDSIRFDNAPDHKCRAIMQYSTGSDEALLFGLQPNALYHAEIRLNELIEGPASLTDLFRKGEFLRSLSTAAADSDAGNEAPELKMVTNGSKGTKLGDTTVHSWKLSGRSVSEMRVSLLVAQNGKAKVAKRYNLRFHDSQSECSIRLVLADEAMEGHLRTVDATLDLNVSGQHGVETNKDETALPVTLEAPFSFDRTPTGLPELRPAERLLLFANGYVKGDLQHRATVDGMIRATDAGTATFLLVTVDWKPAAAGVHGAPSVTTPKRLPSPFEGAVELVPPRKLIGSTLSAIRNRDVQWCFTDSEVEISNNGALLPYEYRQELTKGRNHRRLEASWTITDDGRTLRLSDVRLDGEQLEQDILLPISPAGNIRVNIGEHQYNLRRTTEGN